MNTADYWQAKKRDEFAEVRAKGKPYTTDSESGYIYKGKAFPTWIRGPRITGSNYKPDTCNCGIPPWEECTHSF